MSEMSELRYEAPLAAFDMDEWNDLMDLQTITDVTALVEPPNDNSPRKFTGANLTPGGFCREGTDDFDDESLGGSLEDLVNGFDERITKCFRNYNDHVEDFAPVQINTEDFIDSDIQSWWTLNSRYGNDLHGNGNITSQTEDLLMTSCKSKNDNTSNSAFNHNITRGEEAIICDINDNDNNDDPDYDDESTTDVDEYGNGTDEETDDASENSDDSDEEGDNESIRGSDEPLLSADEVITELECLIDGTTDKLQKAGGVRALSTSVSAELRIYAQSLLDQDSTVEDETAGLKKLSVRALRELKAELEACILEHSETLVQELATRDDFDYEKELKNEFIWLLLTVQRRRKEVMATNISLSEKANLDRNQEVNGNVYLTTVIPYQAAHGPPGIERLQMYIRLLSAINDNCSQVPTLLTDYILRVLCPTT